MSDIAEAKPSLWELFYRQFFLSLFVLGGGYAILLAADDLYGRRLRWLREGELVDNLPLFQTIPGLIAANTAVFVGRRIAGFRGAAVALFATALPSFAIICLIAWGFESIDPAILNNHRLQGAFLFIRAALAGIIIATMVKSWKKSVRGVYGYTALIVCFVAIGALGVSAIRVFLAAMGVGIVCECARALFAKKGGAK